MMLMVWLLFGFQDENWKIDRVEWTDVVPNGSLFQLENPYGDIRIRGTANPELALSAVIQFADGDPEKIEIKREQKDGVFQVSAYFAGDQAKTFAKGGRRRADITIFLPYGTPIVAATGAGLLEAKGLKSDSTFQTFSGKVFYKGQGKLVVETYQGEIQAFFERVSASADFTTKLGTIALHFPRKAEMSVAVRTMGEVTSDYSMTMDVSDSGVRQAQVKVGAGTHQLTVESASGNVKLLERR